MSPNRMLVIAAAVIVFVAGFVIGSSVVAKLVAARVDSAGGTDAAEQSQADAGQDASERPGAAAVPKVRAADGLRSY